MNNDVSNTSDKRKDRTGSYQRSDDVIKRIARLAEQNRRQSEPKAAQESTSSSKGRMTKSGECSTSSHRERKPEGDLGLWSKKKYRGTSKSSQRQSYAAPRYADSSSAPRLRNVDQKKKIPPLGGGTLEDARRYIDGLKESDPTSYQDFRNYENLRKSDSVSIAAEKHPIGHEISKQYQRKYKDSQEESSRSQRETTGQLRLTQSEESRRQRIKEEDEKALRDRGFEPDPW